MKLTEFKTWLFDCDGVLLDSNGIKTDAFRAVAQKHYGKDVAVRFVEYHKSAGGVSRYQKLKALHCDIAGRPFDENQVGRLIREYGELTRSRLMSCQETPSMRLLLNRLRERRTQAYVVSGGAEHELNEVFHERQISSFFGGIYGSPRTKQEILDELSKTGTLRRPAVLVGDSELDFEVARDHSIEFIFMREFSDFREWERTLRGCRVIRNLKELADELL